MHLWTASAPAEYHLEYVIWSLDYTHNTNNDIVCIISLPDTEFTHYRLENNHHVGQSRDRGWVKGDSQTNLIVSASCRYSPSYII